MSPFLWGNRLDTVLFDTCLEQLSIPFRREMSLLLDERFPFAFAIGVGVAALWYVIGLQIITALECAAVGTRLGGHLLLLLLKNKKGFC